MKARLWDLVSDAFYRLSRAAGVAGELADSVAYWAWRRSKGLPKPRRREPAAARPPQHFHHIHISGPAAEGR